MTVRVKTVAVVQVKSILVLDDVESMETVIGEKKFEIISIDSVIENIRALLADLVTKTFNYLG